MTMKLYDESAYLTECTARVLACAPREDGLFDLILDRTVFFPEEGGQSPDRGTISISEPASALSVLDVQIDSEGTIRHTVERELPVGSSVTGRIDWEHRFSNMQNHSGEHIFSGIAHSRFGCTNVGFHLSDSEVSMDYDIALSRQQLQEIEHAVNAAITKNLSIRCYFPDDAELKTLEYRSKKEIEGALRIVEIEDTDVCACCAPHVSSTGQIGLLKVISSQSWKGGTRVFILCGSRALAEFDKLQKAAAVISHEFSVPVSPEDFTAALESRKENTLFLKKQMKELQRELLAAKLAAADPEAENLLLFTEGLEANVKRELLNEQVQKYPGFCAIFDGNDRDGYSFIVASKTLNCNEVIRPLKESFGARGGGKPIMVQGSVKAAAAELKKILTKE